MVCTVIMLLISCQRSCACDSKTNTNYPPSKQCSGNVIANTLGSGKVVIIKKLNLPGVYIPNCVENTHTDKYTVYTYILHKYTYIDKHTGSLDDGTV